MRIYDLLHVSQLNDLEEACTILNRKSFLIILTAKT